MAPHPNFNRGPPLAIFSSPHFASLDISLSRHGLWWFLTYPRAYGMVAYSGQRIHARLNVPDPYTSREARRVFWFNPDWTIDGPVANPFNMLVEADPPVVRLTGRKRMEKQHGKNSGAEIECVEMEVLISEEGLLRQCCYCLDWEQQGVHRFKNCGSKGDFYWCSNCQAKGKVVAWVWSSMRDLQGYNIVSPSSGNPAEPRIRRDSLYTST